MWRRDKRGLSHGGLKAGAPRFLANRREEPFEDWSALFRTGSTVEDGDTAVAASAPRQRETTKAPATLGK